jgi:hypothetical protein
MQPYQKFAQWMMRSQDMFIGYHSTEKEIDANASVLSVTRDETKGCLRGPKTNEACHTQTFGRAHTQNIYIECWDGVRAWQTMYQ